MIFALRQLQEKCIKQNIPLCSVFISLTTAFNIINRKALWTVLGWMGCLWTFVKILQQFHDGMTGQVLNGGDATEPFEISYGAKQGCVLAPVLFKIFFTCMMAHAVQDLESGLYIWYRLDGSLFDLSCLTDKTKSLFTLIQEALFADDCALVTHEDSDLQLVLDCFSPSAKLFGLTISLERTEVLHQPVPGSNSTAPVITIDSTQLANVESFKYLASIISQDGTLDREVDAWIGKANQALVRPCNNILNQHNVCLSTKLKVYSAVVIPSLI